MARYKNKPNSGSKFLLVSICNLLAYAVASAPEIALELLYHIMFIMSIAKSDGSVLRYGTNVTLFSKNSSI